LPAVQRLWQAHSVGSSQTAKPEVNWSSNCAASGICEIYAHYFFASTTAHVTAMFTAFFAAGIALGTPPMLLGLLLAFSSSLNMSLTHYATGTAPIIFGSGYTTLNEWWVAGAVMSAVNLLLLVLVGSIWWTMLSYIANG
jgi:divalent anion:Na+ symporter, DASS family